MANAWSVRPGSNIDKVHARLTRAMEKAAKTFAQKNPGYRIEGFSGKKARSSGTKWHPGGIAIDVNVIGPNGKALANLQSTGSIGKFSPLATENVGPQVGKELRQRGFLAVIGALLGMLVYIWIRFELLFGIGATMASLHDVLITLGLYAFMGYEFNLTTIAAFLTLIGYSVNDTVVTFDRVRENMAKHRGRNLLKILNDSQNQMLSRTLLTGGTTIFASLMLFLFGGDVIHGFAFIMLVGIIVGTYSSIYIASPFALLWEEWFGSGKKKGKTESKSTDRPVASKAR